MLNRAGYDSKAIQRMKQQAYKEALEQELGQRARQNDLNRVMEDQSKLTEQQQFKINEQLDDMRITNYRNKFADFENNLKRRQDNYSQYVMGPNQDREQQREAIINNRVLEAQKQSQEVDEFQRKNLANQRTLQNMHQRQQLEEKQKMLALQQEMNKSEESRTRARMNEAASIDLMMGEDKRKRQEIYRNMLQGQISYNKALNN